MKLGYIIDNELCIDLIMYSLPSTFSHFIMKFNMHKVEVSVPELCIMLKIVEENLYETPKATIVVVASKDKGKQKSKRNKALKPKWGIQKKGGPKKVKEP